MQESLQRNGLPKLMMNLVRYFILKLETMSPWHHELSPQTSTLGIVQLKSSSLAGLRLWSTSSQMTDTVEDEDDWPHFFIFLADY